jgi:hypothetical protein
MADRVLNVKLLNDGSGRVCVHWLISDEQGLIECKGSIIAGPQGPLVDNSTKKYRVACNPKQNSINPQVRNGETFMCIPTGEIRAVTCPRCLATPEAIQAMAPYVLEAMTKISA